MLRIIFKTRNECSFKPGGKISQGELPSGQKIFAGINGFNSPGCGAVKNLFSTLSQSQLDSLVKRAKEHDHGYAVPDFFSYYFLVCDSEIETDKTLQELRENSFVEWVYTENNAIIPPNQYSVKKPLACFQGYLYDAPLGIGVSFAWRRIGGRGDSAIKFVDIEQGWLLNHESLNLQKIPNSGINHEAFSDHGAAVMGIIMMKDGGSGGIGIAPRVNGSIMSIYRPDGILNIPDAILSALTYLDAGDILLLETQLPDPEDGYRLWPLEIREANFDMIRLATALGITVIEPAGNGNIYSSSGNNLDEYSNSNGQKNFDRTHPGFKDSGAIMVAAATSDVPHERKHYSNYGNRIDCYAWGENILTAGLHPKSSGMAINTYTFQFGGTSGAAAIIAGAAISLQSMMEANYQCRLNSGKMREILSNPIYGTVSAGWGNDDNIGVMPDLEKVTRDFIDKFDSLEGIMPLKSFNIGMSSVYDQAV